MLSKGLAIFYHDQTELLPPLRFCFNKSKVFSSPNQKKNKIQKKIIKILMEISERFLIRYFNLPKSWANVSGLSPFLVKIFRSALFFTKSSVILKLFSIFE